MIGVRSGPEHRAAVDLKLLNPRLGVEFWIEDRALTSAGPPRARSKLRCRAIDLGIDSITRHPGMIMIGHNIACVDWSIAKGGFLCAYRWDGERELDAGKFVWIG